MRNIGIVLLASISFLACKNNNDTVKKANDIVLAQDSLPITYPKLNKFDLDAVAAAKAPIIDGDSADVCWKNVAWYPIDQLWLGQPYLPDDFQGKFKITYNQDKLFLLIAIQDDVLVDHYPKWDSLWWNDDCVEIFVDENRGKELHQYNHKAFAYHVAINATDVVDLSPDKMPHLYNDHLVAKRVTVGNKSLWEIALSVYNDTYIDGGSNTPVKLQKGKLMGFTINYCDSDATLVRENFISSIAVEGADKDLGWKDASVFNQLILR
jgi:Carbohydrate family 9 binding domain-like